MVNNLDIAHSVSVAHGGVRCCRMASRIPYVQLPIGGNNLRFISIVCYWGTNFRLFPIIIGENWLEIIMIGCDQFGVYLIWFRGRFDHYVFFALFSCCSYCYCCCCFNDLLNEHFYTHSSILNYVFGHIVEWPQDIQRRKIETNASFFVRPKKYRSGAVEQRQQAT